MKNEKWKAGKNRADLTDGTDLRFSGLGDVGVGGELHWSCWIGLDGGGDVGVGLDER